MTTETVSPDLMGLLRRLKLSGGRRYPFFADGPVPSDHCPVLARVRFSPT